MQNVLDALLGPEPLGGPQYKSSGPQWLRALGDAAQRVSQRISPFQPSAETAASMLPGGGIPAAREPYQQGLQKTAEATKAFREGRYGDAARWYGSGMLDTGNAALSALPEGGALSKLAMALPMLAKASDGRINLGVVMRDVDRGGLNKLERADMRRMNQAVDAQDWKEAEVPIRSLYATQPFANADFAEAAAKRAADGLDLPLVVRAPDGKMYVRDGHHRLTALADQNAQTAKVRLIDMARQNDLPELPF